MKKSLTINATRAGKKVAKSLGFVNPDASNAVVGTFAQMVNALSNDSYVNSEVVKKMDTTEQETVPEGGGSGGSTADLSNEIFTLTGTDSQIELSEPNADNLANATAEFKAVIQNPALSPKEAGSSLDVDVPHLDLEYYHWQSAWTFVTANQFPVDVSIFGQQKGDLLLFVNPLTAEAFIIEKMGNFTVPIQGFARLLRA